MMIVPLSAPAISLHAGETGVITVRPQRPVRIRRPLVIASPWTRAIQELDTIIADARTWGATHARVWAPAHPELGEISLGETSVIAALQAERAALCRWAPVGRTPDGWVPAEIDLLRLVAGNTDHLASEVPLDLILQAALLPIPVQCAQDFAAHIRNTSSSDREIMLTWFCDVAE